MPWLVKSEPDAFSWAQHVAAGTEPWTGVRNHAARNNLRAMRVGERAFFYHSGTGREIVGVVEVAREAYPDPTARDGPWLCVDLRAIGTLPRPVTLAQVKAEPTLATMALARLSRLSVGPVSEAEWQRVCAMGEWEEGKAGRFLRCPSNDPGGSSDPSAAPPRPAKGPRTL